MTDFFFICLFFFGRSSRVPGGNPVDGLPPSSSFSSRDLFCFVSMSDARWQSCSELIFSRDSANHCARRCSSFSNRPLTTHAGPFVYIRCYTSLNGWPLIMGLMITAESFFWKKGWTWPDTSWSEWKGCSKGSGGVNGEWRSQLGGYTGRRVSAVTRISTERSGCRCREQGGR